jgi:hypothetical protein
MESGANAQHPTLNWEEVRCRDLKSKGRTPNIQHRTLTEQVNLPSSRLVRKLSRAGACQVGLAGEWRCHPGLAPFLDS